jgi:hypothetical protein
VGLMKATDLGQRPGHLWLGAAPREQPRVSVALRTAASTIAILGFARLAPA